ncbi:MAG: preprotein translocase subunit SecE [Patescibacteria group bacterium]
MSFIQYLKDTRSELRHVAWPTRMQTVMYTIIVIVLSVFVALYLGFFDFIFTTGLSRGLLLLPQNGNSAPTEQLATTSITDITYSTSTPQ